MPIKGQSPKETINTELHKFKHRQLHSGSKHGPLVINRKQAIAIALNEARKAGKKAQGGKAGQIPLPERRPKGADGWKAAGSIEDRRDTDPRFYDPQYFPQPQEPRFTSPITYGNPLANDLGAANLDLKAMGFADGGDVDDSWKDREAREGLVAQGIEPEQLPAPQRDWGKGLSRWWYGDQPAPGPDAQGNLPEVSMTQDPVSRMLATPVDLATQAHKAYTEGLTPEEQTEFGVNTALMNMIHPPVEGGLGVGPAYTKGITGEKITDLHDLVLNGSEHPNDSHPAPQAIAKDLKATFPKDIAQSAFYLGLNPEDIVNLKSHMSPGAQAAFNKHYNKLIGSVGPGFEDFKMPEEKAAPEFQPPSEFGIQAKQFHKDADGFDLYEPAQWAHYDDLHKDLSNQPLKLTPEQKAAVSYWGDPVGYKDINGYLRGLNDSTKAPNTIKALNSAMQPLAQDTVAWRGLHGPHAAVLNGLKPGDSFWNAGYSATTIDPRMATHYGMKEDPGTIINYHLPEGQKALYTSHPDAGGWSQNERELLLPHGAQWTIKGIEKIKAPVWDYNGNVKDASSHEFTVYHVEPKQGEFDMNIPMLDYSEGAFPTHPDAFKPGADMEEPPNSLPAFTSGYYVKETPDGKFAISHKDATAGAWYTETKAGSPEEAIKKFQSQYPHIDLGKAEKYSDKDIEDYFNEQYDTASKDFSPEQKSPVEERAEKHLKPLNWQSYSPDLPPVAKSKALELSKKLSHTTEHGFNPNVPIYKGGFWEIPNELFDPFKTKNYERAFFAAHDPYVAKQYGTVTEPYIARAPTAFEVNWPDVAGHEGYDAEIMHKLIEAARKKNADVIAIHNIHDLGGPQTQYAFLNTHVLRQPNAKFDPTQLHLRYPLAGLAGGGLFAYGALQGQGQQKQMKRGGKVKHKQIDEDPQDHEFINFSKGGLIDSHIPGRTDKIPMRVRPGSYVLPADIPSALGEGNSKAGAEILKKMFTHSAYGLPPPNMHTHAFQYPHHLNMGTHRHARGGKVAAEKALPEDHQLGMRVPKGGSMCANCKFLEGKNLCGNKAFQKWNGSDMLPYPANEYCCDLYDHTFDKKADGGHAEHTPIIAAGGEFIIHPDVVKAIGNGSMKDGHKQLDKFVLHARKENIKTLKGLKPPK